jgi:GNAT superfamily N-acetyltransferase
MIRACSEQDFPAIWAIINDGADAYGGIIPPDRLRTPYMSEAELRHELLDGVRFWGYESDRELQGVMGVQDIKDVTLVRHAYVRTGSQNRGIGGELLRHLRTLTARPVLVGTWAAAEWAIRFYRRHGFELVSPEEKDRLLRTYWNIPDRQIETSVVLADETWRAQHSHSLPHSG